MQVCVMADDEPVEAAPPEITAPDDMTLEATGPLTELDIIFLRRMNTAKRLPSNGGSMW